LKSSHGNLGLWYEKRELSWRDENNWTWDEENPNFFSSSSASLSSDDINFTWINAKSVHISFKLYSMLLMYKESEYDDDFDFIFHGSCKYI
jgi:hypothetical protein